jgi:hypothetical protein
VQQIFPLITVVQKHVDQEERPSVFTKNRHSLPRNRGDEKVRCGSFIPGS